MRRLLLFVGLVAAIAFLASRTGALAHAAGPPAASPPPGSAACVPFASPHACDGSSSEAPDWPSVLKGLVADGWTLTPAGQALVHRSDACDPPDGATRAYIIATRGEVVAPFPAGSTSC